MKDEYGWFFINARGEDILKQRFASAQPFSHGWGGVFTDGSWRLINEVGEFMAGEFEWLLPFNEGFAAVRMNGRFFYIDLTGEKAFEGTYELADSFVNGFARVTLNGAEGFINLNGFFNIAGYRQTEPNANSEGLFPYEAAGKWGYKDKTGVVRLKPKYTEARNFSHGIAAVRTEKWFFINTRGEKLFGKFFDNAFHFHLPDAQFQVASYRLP